LTPRERVSFKQMSQAFDLASDGIARPARRTAPGASSPQDLVAAFRSQLFVYTSYWRDDPEFDRTNTASAIGELPCPVIDTPVLARICRYAMRANFVPPHEASPRSVPEVQQTIESAAGRLGRATLSRQGDTSVGLEVTGAGGGQWTLFSRGGALTAVQSGATAPDLLMYCNSETFANLAHERLGVQTALAEGRLSIERANDDPTSPDTAIGTSVLKDLLRRAADARSRQDARTHFPAELSPDCKTV
jgi:hypothetical protein